MSLPFPVKPKACAVCEELFRPFSSTASVCSQRCAMKKVKKDKAAAKVALKARKDARKTPNELKPLAQAAFNAFIRARDADEACVSCDVVNPPMLPGGQWDAGHFLSRGAYPELAFDEDNCHKQCKSCNAGSGKFAHKARTVSQKYEVEIERRIGAERLARLKGPHPPAKRTADDYRELTATYKAKLKELQKEQS